MPKTSKKELIKPIAFRPEPRYDFIECRDYLQTKYGFDMRDYAGYWKNRRKKNPPPHQDFWHWMCDHFEISNGCDFFMSQEDLDSHIEYPGSTPMEQWQIDIYKLFLKEFGGKNKEIHFEVSW